MKRTDAKAFLEHDWECLERLKSAFWKEQKKRLTPTEVFLIGNQLRETARLLHPGWPTEEDRQEDLETHIRVATVLRSVR